MSEPLLQLRITVDFPGRPGVLHDAALELGAGEILGLVGSSGVGKSTLALAILGLLPLKGGRCFGEVLFRGRDLLAASASEMRSLRGREIALVPQSPIASLNPSLRLGDQLLQAWRAHEKGEPGWRQLLDSVSLPVERSFLRLYPRNLSVGLAQRFLIAMALLHRPPLLLADEATSALDLITQAEILSLFKLLNARLGLSILYISHDLSSVASLCHRVAILHKGAIVECASVADVFANPQHPYTRELIGALPDNTGLLRLSECVATRRHSPEDLRDGAPSTALPDAEA